MTTEESAGPSSVIAIGKAEGRTRAGALASLLLAAVLAPGGAMAEAGANVCAPKPSSALIVDVRDKGAKGNGTNDDTAAIQAAIDAVGGTGGTALVPAGTYLVDAVGKDRLKLKSDMTLKLARDAVLEALPTSSKKYAVLTISGAANVTVTGGTLEGERDRHQGKTGEGGMGIRIDRDAENITIAGVTARKMWGDGFYVEDAKDVRFCGVVADGNRRQGLSIIAADRVTVTGSVFKNTHGTRPSAGIDLEPDADADKVTNISIVDSKFLDNAGSGIQIAGKRGRVAKVEIARNMFRGNRPLLVEDAPAVRAASICANRQVAQETAATGGLNAYADPVALVVHQNDCGEGTDLRFETNRAKRKPSK
jgi:Pectate lyase superfamily protein